MLGLEMKGEDASGLESMICGYKEFLLFGF